MNIRKPGGNKNPNMKTDLLIKILGTSDEEKKLIKSFVDKYGFDELFNNLESASLSNKTKMSIVQLHQVIHNGKNAMANLSALTEIPLKVLQGRMNKGEIVDILEHPERLDIDNRQLFKFRCVNAFYFSYQNEQDAYGQEEQHLPER